MKAKYDRQSIEKAMLESLKHGGFRKEQLEELVEIVAGLYEAGLQKIRLFPRGIPPVVDGLELQANVELGGIAETINRLLRETAISSVKIFPYGVPVFDGANLVVELGPGAADG